jgi:hypothetical protein
VSSRLPDVAEGLTRGWVRLYTLGLEPVLRTMRRAELESDLWEHRQWSTTEGRRPGRLAVEIVERLLAGMAADLSWRVEHRRLRRQEIRPLGGGIMIGLLKRHGMMALTVALGVLTISLAIAAAAFGDVQRSQVAAMLVAGLVLLGGLVAMRRGLRGGRTAVALGAIVPGALLVWTVILPIVTLAVLIWLFAGRRPHPAPAQPA